MFDRFLDISYIRRKQAYASTLLQILSWDETLKNSLTAYSAAKRHSNPANQSNTSDFTKRWGRIRIDCWNIFRRLGRLSPI